MQDLHEFYKNKDKTIYEEKAKEPKYEHILTRYYAIFRIGKKFKSINQISGFQRHMEREMYVPNSNGVKNEVLIGTHNIGESAALYTKGIKFRKNQVVGRELLLTATHGFFNMPDSEIKKWKEININWLEDNFGSNCVYAVLHKDETTYHIHALIIPKFINANGKAVLSNARYFDGIQKLRRWQDNYAASMQNTFKALNRGIRFSKAKHIEIRHFYAMLNSKLNEKDLQQVCARSTQSELLLMKLKALEKTMNTYKKFYNKSNEEKLKLMDQNKELFKAITDLKKDKQLNKEVIESLSELYKIPQNAVKNVISYVEKNIENEKKSGKEK